MVNDLGISLGFLVSAGWSDEEITTLYARQLEIAREKRPEAAPDDDPKVRDLVRELVEENDRCHEILARVRKALGSEN